MSFVFKKKVELCNQLRGNPPGGKSDWPCLHELSITQSLNLLVEFLNVFLRRCFLHCTSRNAQNTKKGFADFLAFMTNRQMMLKPFKAFEY